MQKYDDAIRAKVVLGWKTGTSAKALSRENAIPVSTVRLWVKDETRLSPVPPPTPKNKRTIDDLAYDLLHETLLGLTAIARKAQDADWLDRQEANGLHLLLGVGADKVIRLYEAMDPDRLREIEAGCARLPSGVGVDGD